MIRQENQGVARARNAGARREADTPYVLVLDADDRIVPGALSELRAALEADPSLGFAYGRMRFFGDWDGELRFPPYDPYVLLYRHTIGLSALARQEVFRSTGGFDPSFEQFEDWEHWVHALAFGWEGRQVDAVTVEYRRHGGSKQSVDRASYRDTFRRLREKHSGSIAASARRGWAHWAAPGTAGSGASGRFRAAWSCGCTGCAGAAKECAAYRR